MRRAMSQVEIGEDREHQHEAFDDLAAERRPPRDVAGSVCMIDVIRISGRSVLRPVTTGISSPYAHKPSRLVMTGVSTKLYGGGGDVVAHSSVSAPHGFGPASSPRLTLHSRLKAKMS